MTSFSVVRHTHTYPRAHISAINAGKRRSGNAASPAGEGISGATGVGIGDAGASSPGGVGNSSPSPGGGNSGGVGSSPNEAVGGEAEENMEDSKVSKKMAALEAQVAALQTQLSEGKGNATPSLYEAEGAEPGSEEGEEHGN